MADVLRGGPDAVAIITTHRPRHPSASASSSSSSVSVVVIIRFVIYDQTPLRPREKSFDTLVKCLRLRLGNAAVLQETGTTETGTTETGTEVMRCYRRMVTGTGRDRTRGETGPHDAMRVGSAADTAVD
ncbi:unnamed protein product [Merluccius merluccius]